MRLTARAAVSPYAQLIMGKIPTLSAVLVSTDYSALANQAIAYAYAVVDDGGTVHLLHVVEVRAPGRAPNPLYAHYAPGHVPTRAEREQIHAECAERLRELVPGGLESRRIRTEVHVVDNLDIASAVVHTAEVLGVAAICVASHGRSGVVKALLGSVAERVLHSAGCPVMVVRARQE